MGGHDMGGPPPGVHHVPPGMNPPPGGAGFKDVLLRDLIVALWQKALNTNNQPMQLGRNIADGVNNSNRGDQGYRHLKPTKDTTKATAESAEGLMIELVQFEVDIG